MTTRFQTGKKIILAHALGPQRHLQGGARGEKCVETSASVCLRPVLPRRSSWTSGSSSRLGPCLASSLMAVSSRLLGEMERCGNMPVPLVSPAKNRGCGGGTQGGDPPGPASVGMLWRTNGWEQSRTCNEL